jgi:hypothetical protein
MADESRRGTVLLEWESPERVFVKRSKKYFQNLFAILFVLAGVAIFFREFVLAAVFGGFGFLQYVLGTVPPRGTKHQITSKGLRTLGHMYLWDELIGFWFDESNGETTLCVDTRHFFPGRLTLLLGDQGKEKVASILEKYIPSKERPPEDVLDKLSSKISQRVRLD